jgi:hypothetical protein
MSDDGDAIEDTMTGTFHFTTLPSSVQKEATDSILVLDAAPSTHSTNDMVAVYGSNPQNFSTQPYSWVRKWRKTTFSTGKTSRNLSAWVALEDD